MTLHALSAGDGYAYYTSEVASADVKREAGRELGDYYTADGNPAGVWLGAGTALLGVEGTVSEDQMRALYGEGLHPNADAMLDELTAAGVSANAAQEQVKLGRRYYSYQQPDGSLGEAIRTGYAEFSRRNGREPSADERRVIRTREGAIAFRAARGREPGNKEELGRFITAASRPGQQAVAGFDLVFSPAKSVSTLWALGDDATRRTIEQAHEDAIASTVKYLEREAIATRAGVNGVAQIDVEGGIVATRFRHYDARSGDPQLHDHLVVANKVRGTDGRWRTIDSKLLHRQGVAASEHYNQHVMANVASRLGVTTEYREVTAGKRPVLEIAGIDTTLTESFSSRSSEIKTTVKQLAAEYRQQHGRAPDAKARIALAQQATLQTRPAKASARSLRDLRAQWRRDAIQATREDVVDDLLDAARRRVVHSEAKPLDVDEAARQVVATVSEHHAVWGAHTIEAETRRHLLRELGPAGVTEEDVTRVARAALRDGSLTVTPPAPHQAFEPLTRRDGTSIYEHKGRTLYTSRGVLDAEDALLSAGRERTFQAVTEAQFAETLLEHGAKLDDGQRALARAFATDERRLIVGTGPAGTGKTTALRVAARAVEHAGGKLIGLAPSAAAAAVFSEDAGVHASTVHSFLATYDLHGDVSDTSLHPTERRLAPGDVIVVDEAGMAGTVNLARVTAIAECHGAVVRLIGDDRQLGAVESGGALRLLERELGSVQLESVHRFRDHDEAAATLRLRDPLSAGDPFDWYLQEGRVTAGNLDRMVDDVFAAWQSDVTAGTDSLMLAQTNESVRELNSRAQAFGMAAGTVHGARSAALRDGLEAHVGDTILTRRNDRQMRVGATSKSVHNGDRWSVVAVGRDGSLTVEHASVSGKLTLPADYVRQHTELGYASTIHRAQGATVDRAHVLADESTTRELAYVGLTRGRVDNRLYVSATDGQDMRDVLGTIAANHDGTLSAHESIRAEQTRVDSVPVLMEQYQDVAGRANLQRYVGTPYVALDVDTADRVVAGDAWPALTNTLHQVEKAGYDAVALTYEAAAAAPLDADSDAAAQLHERISTLLEESQAARGREESLAPLAASTDAPRLPEWIADRSLVDDQRIAPEWRAHLAERYEHLADRLEQREAALVDEQPTWSRDLGAVPHDPTQRAEWARTAAEIETFRARYRLPDTTAEAVPEQFQHGRLGRELAQRAEALRERPQETPAPPTTAERSEPTRAAGDGLTALQRRVLERTGRKPEATPDRTTGDAAEAARRAAEATRAAEQQRQAQRGRDSSLER